MPVQNYCQSKKFKFKLYTLLLLWCRQLLYTSKSGSNEVKTKIKWKINGSSMAISVDFR